MRQLRCLLRAAPSCKRENFKAYMGSVIKNDECFGIDATFLGFIEDYYLLAKMMKNHCYGKKPYSTHRIPRPYRNFIIYDIGCATAFQHVFFKKCTKYIAIDYNIPKPEFFTDNCQFVNGKFSDLIKSGELIIPGDTDVDVFAIANMSLLYQAGNEEDVELFNKLFKRKFII
jgi:hypothetical protein